jgi:regulation of enolase protein 1 (concanavalin A-like superfamily)
MNLWNSTRRRSPLPFGLAVVVASIFGYVFSSGRAAAEDGANANEFRFLAFDGFAGNTSLNWHPVRYDPTHVSLNKHPGKLTITTQRGTIHRNEKARDEPSARNIYVIDNPLAKDTDFALSTCVISFQPKNAYQQAGLICYDDDDNYLKWCYQFNWRTGSGQTFSLLRETKGQSEIMHIPSPPDAPAVWLRIMKRGNSYEFAASTDGKKFRVYGTESWGDGAPAKVGIYAKNGGPEGVPELDASFDFFEVRSPVPANN